MIIEILQLFDLLFFGRPHILILYFLAFSTFYILIAIKSRRHKPYVGDFKSRTSMIVPVYNEEVVLFTKVLEAARPQTNQLIVVLDGENLALQEVAKKHADVLIQNIRRRGKRMAISNTLKYVENPVTVLLDSDTIPTSTAISELLKPLNDPKIGIVQGQPHILHNFPSSFISRKLSDLIERSRHVICSALNPHLMVVDGRMQAVRTELLMQTNKELLRDEWFGRKSEIGEDRCRTRLIHKLGLESAYQPTAVCYTKPPSTLLCFLKQQLRWYRSGYKFFFKDLEELHFPSKTYFAQSVFFYLSSILFTLAVLGDILFLPLVYPLKIPLMGAPFIAILGSSLVTLLRQGMYYGFKNIEYRYIMLYGVIGLFLIYPLMLYALCTVKEQGNWITR